MGVRENILQAGLSILRDKGVATVTQTRVAEVAGCKQSHLTYYFPTRNDLLLALAEFAVDSILSTLSTRLKETPCNEELAEAFTESVIEGLPPRVILGLIVISDGDPNIRRSLSRLIASVRTRIRSLLEQAGLAHGEEDALLFHAVVAGLAVMHQARLTDDSKREIEIGMQQMIKRLAMPGGNGGANVGNL